MSPAPNPTPTQPGAKAVDPARRRARLAVSTLYLLTGTAAGSWSARAPAIHDHLAVSDGLWGVGLTAASLAEVVALVLVLFAVHAVAPRRLALTGAVVVLASTPLLGWVSTMAQLVGVLACWFFAAQLMAAPMGGMAIEVGRRYGRSLMASFAAVWTVGTALGAGVSTVAAAAGVSLGVQFNVSSVLLGVVIGIGARWLPEPGASPEQAASVAFVSPDEAAGPSRRVRQRRSPRRGRLLRRWTAGMWLIAGVSLAGAYTSSALGQWSALYVHAALQHDAELSTQRVAAVASGTVTAMFVTGGAVLLVADRVRSRVGAVVFVRWSVGCAVAGLVGALVYPTVGVVVAGLVLLAVGSACVGPTVDALAGEQTGLRPAEGIAVAEAGQLPGFLLCPLVVGTLAGFVGLRVALLSVVVALGVTAVLIGRLSSKIVREGTGPRP